jgi:hypothetical protein
MSTTKVDESSGIWLAGLFWLSGISMFAMHLVVASRSLNTSTPRTSMHRQHWREQKKWRMQQKNSHREKRASNAWPGVGLETCRLQKRHPNHMS